MRRQQQDGAWHVSVILTCRAEKNEAQPSAGVRRDQACQAGPG